MGGPFLLYSGCNNRRVFDERDLKWIQDLVCLKKCGMSIQEMKAYLDLCLQGPATIPQRKEMLTQKQEALRRLHRLEADVLRRRPGRPPPLREQPDPAGKRPALTAKPPCRLETQGAWEG